MYYQCIRYALRVKLFSFSVEIQRW